MRVRLLAVRLVWEGYPATGGRYYWGHGGNGP